MHTVPLIATNVAQTFMRQFLKPRDLCIDATAGNGYDTVFLCRQVRDHGQVLAIDIQASALEATARRLDKEAIVSGFQLVQGDHSQLNSLVPEEWKERTRVICFNLGFLPRGDKKLTTQSATTIPALQSALPLLAPGGLLCVTAYPGHEEGAQETKAVDTLFSNLSGESHTVHRFSTLNTTRPAPVVYAVSRLPTNA